MYMEKTLKGNNMKHNMKYKKDYWGYVYIWMDTKRNKFCIGSHHGSVEDSYVTSSKYMLNAYSKRPEDFKMRVLEYNTTDDNYLSTQKLEQKALDLIHDDELGTKYYNLKKWATGGNNCKGKLWYHNPLCTSQRGIFSENKAPTGWILGSGYSTTTDWVWYHNPKNITEDIKLPPNQEAPAGWIRGRPNIPCIGFWFKDPNSDDVPYGWVRGRHDACTSDSKWAYNKNNKSEYSLIMPHDELPSGWVYGMVHKGAGLSYHHPRTLREIKLLPHEDIPSGFVRGGAPRAKKMQKKYGSMSVEEFEAYCSTASSRAKKLATRYRSDYFGQ